MGTTATPKDTTERAARLRLAITRTARRMRQEAGSELGPRRSVSALATIERAGPLTSSELAKAERHQAPDRQPAARPPRGGGARHPDARSRRRPLLDRSPPRAEGTALLKRLRGRKNAYLATTNEEASRRRRRSRSSAPRRSSSGCSRRTAIERRPPQVLRLPLQVPNYRLYFGGQARLAGRQLDADRRRALADPEAHRLRRRGRLRHRPAVHRHPRLRRLRRRARRPLRQAQAADDQPGRHGRAGDRPLRHRRSPASPRPGWSSR